MRAAEVQAAKDVVWEVWSGRSRSAVHPEVEFHGAAPVGHITGAAAVHELVNVPIAESLLAPRWEPHVFLGGVWDDEVWVAHTGLLHGMFSAPLFGIPPSGRRASLRYGEFARVEDGQVVEIRALTDLVGLAAQAGRRLLPLPPVDDGPPSGPAAANGVMRTAGDPADSATTLALVESMIAGCNRLEGSDLASMGMADYWHDDMVWHGPAGIGTTRGFDEFQRHAQGPSVASFPDRRGGHHRARIAEGPTAAFTGWPSLQGSFTGEAFRGIAPTGGPIGQNIMDFYVRRGPKLYENWVLIDFVDFAAQCGVDLLEGLTE